MPVYMIQIGEAGPVKVGYSRDPAERLRSMQSAHPLRLRVVRMLDGTKLDEARIQIALADLRMVGEWFQYDKRLFDDFGLRDLPLPITPMMRDPAPKNGGRRRDRISSVPYSRPQFEGESK